MAKIFFSFPDPVAGAKPMQIISALTPSIIFPPTHALRAYLYVSWINAGAATSHPRLGKVSDFRGVQNDHITGN